MNFSTLPPAPTGSVWHWPVLLIPVGVLIDQLVFSRWRMRQTSVRVAAWLAAIGALVGFGLSVITDRVPTVASPATGSVVFANGLPIALPAILLAVWAVTLWFSQEEPHAIGVGSVASSALLMIGALAVICATSLTEVVSAWFIASLGWVAVQLADRKTPPPLESRIVVRGFLAHRLLDLAWIGWVLTIAADGDGSWWGEFAVTAGVFVAVGLFPAFSLTNGISLRSPFVRVLHFAVIASIALTFLLRIATSLNTRIADRSTWALLLSMVAIFGSGFLLLIERNRARTMCYAISLIYASVLLARFSPAGELFPTELLLLGSIPCVAILAWFRWPVLPTFEETTPSRFPRLSRMRHALADRQLYVSEVSFVLVDGPVRTLTQLARISGWILEFFVLAPGRFAVAYVSWLAVPLRRGTERVKTVATFCFAAVVVMVFVVLGGR